MLWRAIGDALAGIAALCGAALIVGTYIVYIDEDPGAEIGLTITAATFVFLTFLASLLRAWVRKVGRRVVAPLAVLLVGGVATASTFEPREAYEPSLNERTSAVTTYARRLHPHVVVVGSTSQLRSITVRVRHEATRREVYGVGEEVCAFGSFVGLGGWTVKVNWVDERGASQPPAYECTVPAVWP